MADENAAGSPPAGQAPAGGAPAGGTPAAAQPSASSTPPASGAPNGAQPPANAGENNAAGEGNASQAGEAVVYTDFTAPEGVVLAQPVLDKFKGIAGKHKLSQEAAQELLTELGPEIAQHQQREIADAVEKAQTEWTAAAKIDPEYGGERFDANLEVAKRGMEAFATPELKQLLKASGMGSNPEVIRLFYRIGKTVKEDTYTAGGAPKGEKSAAQVLFG